MFERSNIELDCAICYDEMTEENCIMFDCNHTCCRSCSQEIIFKPEWKCPLDMKSFETISTEHQTLPTVQYQLEIWNKRSPSIKAKVENYWSEIIYHLIKTLKSVVDNFILINEELKIETKNYDDLKCIEKIVDGCLYSIIEFDYRR